MKLKKMVFLGLVICGLMAAGSLPAVAQSTWCTCAVNGIGPYGVGTNASARIFLTDLANPPAWDGSKEYRLGLNRMNQFMAMAATAIVSGNKVRALVDPADPNGVVGALYLLDE